LDKEDEMLEELKKIRAAVEKAPLLRRLPVYGMNSRISSRSTRFLVWLLLSS
jgi:hypothetical protein